MKVLVTGASGNVGRYVVKELLKMGENVVVAGTDIKKLKTMFGDKVDAVEFDFTNRQTFMEALHEVDRVFLMRPPHLGKPQDLYPFIDIMKSSNIKLVSFLSLMGVEHNTIPPHHKIEKYIENIGIPYAHIRPGFFMQNVSGIHAKEIKEQDKILVPAGKSKASFIDAKDIGLSIAVLLHEPERYKNTAHTITGPQALDYYQVADILSTVLGRKITYDKPGYLKYRQYYINNRGLDKKYVNVTVALYFMTRMGTAKEVTDGFYRLTGRQPRTFKDFAKENKEVFLK
ncbi:NmrA family NAD(P)-binding protein [Mobilitalea sibirica]|uniref:NmrA family NAD(P)-binding protein n=1 Tax=Mobilitalea sibirica TaxID=1462919 RepID=A0A8J7H1E4_9FIRM|nr:NmrA family NAD(P)-binding protein [Mobilitalea sibirica]MBH1939945.1 NmrA family NAD(P)-binding protein [Mobilitalea sibirica]